MPNRYLRLIFWTLLFDLIFYEFRFLAEEGLGTFIKSWSGLKGIALGSSGMLTFQLFALGAYLTLYHFNKKSIFKTAFFISLNVIVIIGFRYSLEEVIFPSTLGFDNFNDRIPNLSYFFINL